MKKLKLIIVLFFILFAESANYQLITNEPDGLSKNDIENKLSFEPSEFQLNLFGELPSPQVFSNTISESPTLFSKKGKSKALIIRLTHPISKVYSNLFSLQYSFFSRYCSVFVQIYLKTACFRL